MGTFLSQPTYYPSSHFPSISSTLYLFPTHDETFLPTYPILLFFLPIITTRSTAYSTWSTSPANSCLRSTTPPSNDGREYAAFPEGCEYAAFPEGEEDQQQHVVYNPQPATARGLQPLLAALC